MKSIFSPLIQKYFEHWIDLETWDSTHWADRERFYQFVKACKRYGKKKVSSSDVKAAIKEAVISKRPDFKKEVLDELAEKFSQEFQIIIEYEETPFPDDSVEMTNPFKVSLYLRSQVDGKGKRRYSESEIQEILEKEFGENWREKYVKKYVGEAVPPERLKEPSQELPDETK